MSTISTDLPKVLNYRAISLIHESDRTLVYRARNEENGQSVVIKLMRNEYPSFNELVQFRNQYAISKNLEIEGIVKTHVLERYENRYALIMEDMGGVSLAEYKGKTTLSISEFIEIAIQLADILHHLHQNNIIHKDIKPANILIHPETQQIQLIDFSISTLLPKETQSLQTPNVLEGTLAYLSPEQTGRMNRGIDYRSDFYGLGVTFYELLTGNVPFTHDDPLELIHAHIAQNPDPPSKWVCLEGKFCPAPLSNIVLKLMAKNAEDRYQSALGLKYDLERCLTQDRETGEIAPFELGERDLCDRFIIPEKLYGREKEVQALLDAFERVTSPSTPVETLPATSLHPRAEMMLVAGFSGIGKTAVVNEVHKPITRHKGYFIKGKFDQFNRNIPFSAFVQAFRSLMGQLLSESDTVLAAWRSKILEALGESGQVLIDVIPELERIIGKQPDAPELSGSAAQNRFKLLFGKFVQVFATPEHPLVIFLDDLQWADSASLNLLKLLMTESETGYLLVLGAYRDNEVFPAHPFILALEEIRKEKANVNTLTLAPLRHQQITCLVADALQCSPETTKPLSKLIFQKTRGNPFFTTQFLQGLYEDKYIIFDAKAGYWQCDLTRVREAALTDDVVEFMAGRLHKLPETTQNVLKLAACIGNQFDLETLAIICEISSEEVATNLWNALREGLILPQSEAYKFFQGWEKDEKKADNIAISYRFLHDRVQQAAYSLIPDGRQPEIYLKIGQLLLHSIPKSQQEERIFEIVDPLNLAVDIIVDPVLKEELIYLNLLAGRHAKAVTAYDAAFQYLRSAIALLNVDTWQHNYTKTLEIYNLAVEVAYLSGCFSQMESWTTVVLSNAASIYDRIPVARIKLQALSGGEQGEVVREALDLLAELDIFLPRKPTPADLQQAREITEKMLARQPISNLVDLPPMNDRHFLAVAAILQASMPTSYRIEPNLFQLMVLKLIQLSLEHGNTSLSSFGYACYALMCCSSPQTINIGYEVARVALAVAEKMSDRSLQARTLFVVSVFVHVWELPLDNVLEELQRAYQLCLDAGDLEFVGHTALHYCYTAFFRSQHLQSLKPQVYSYFHALQKFGQEVCANYIKPYQITIDLLVNSNNPDFSVEEFQSELSRQQARFKADNDLYGLFTCHLNELIVHYWFGNFQQARADANLAYEYINAVAGDFIVAILYFYASLTYLQLHPKQNLKEQSTTLEKVIFARGELLSFAGYVPTNYQHQYDLLQAEYHRILGEKLEAIEYYDRAIARAKENEYIQEEALANELAAKFYLEWGKEAIAEVYLNKAYYGYAQWGAKAKTDYLEQCYPQILQPILQRERITLSSGTSISKITSTAHSATIANISSILDFSSLLKASQALSGEIELDRLLSKLMKTILENAGATKGALLLTNEMGLTVEAIATRTDTKNELEFASLHQSILLDDYPDLPAGLINYVRRTTETALLDAKTAQTQFAADNYLLRFSPQSLLCLPLLERGNLIGVLYLENNLTADAFTSDRVDLLDVLCAQAAISLTNARLYQQAQQALKDLQQTQLQLVQNEKMATLGNLVAGVAHEINNPVGFIGGNVSAAQEHLQDLLEVVSLYQENTSPPEEIAEAIEDLDPEFIAEDFPKLIASMQKGCDRIRNISTSLRTFSRTDADKQTEFNLHDGIDSTLLILKYRLKANEQRPAIEIVKNYSDIPEVKCYAGQLNQVFMNLLANAIDALDESNKGKTYDEIEKDPNCITIKTELNKDKKKVLVRITDNGMGMREEVKAKIFEQGFTTKEVGKGTGLGMAIARQIITEKHDGTIVCFSEFGKGTEFIISLPSL